MVLCSRIFRLGAPEYNHATFPYPEDTVFFTRHPCLIPLEKPHGDPMPRKDRGSTVPNGYPPARGQNRPCKRVQASRPVKKRAPASRRGAPTLSMRDDKEGGRLRSDHRRAPASAAVGAGALPERPNTPLTTCQASARAPTMNTTSPKVRTQRSVSSSGCCINASLRAYHSP